MDRWLSFRLCARLSERLQGLLFKKPDEQTILLVPCADVHTWGMKHNIDVAFVDIQGVVMDVYRNVKPRRRLRQRGAVATLERFSQEGSDWVCAGDRLAVERLEMTACTDQAKKACQVGEQNK